MKKITLFALLLCLTGGLLAQDTVFNRYAMRLVRNYDDSFELVNKNRYAELYDLQSIPYLFVPYRHVRSIVTTNDYRHIQSKEFVFKTYNGQELTLAVDLAESDEPTPFMIYIHGGGWQRGTKGANRSLSRYAAAKGGVTGVRISYTLSPQLNSTVKLAIQDVLDALKWVQENAEKLNINPNIFGFYGGSAGAHLAAMATFKTPGTRVFIGQSGIYDLQKAQITAATRNAERIRYFGNLDPQFLYEVSPINHISRGNLPAVFIYHGTADLTVEVEQSKLLAEKLKANGIQVLKFDLYPHYEHTLNSSNSDLQEKLLLDSFQFIIDHLK